LDRALPPPPPPLGPQSPAVFESSVAAHAPRARGGAVDAHGHALVAPNGGCSIHAVDHVLAGWGADEHRAKLDRIVAALGLSADDLAQQIAAMEADPETYFVSAEAHNRWRGDLPYEQYAMRRIGSVNLFKRA